MANEITSLVNSLNTLASVCTLENVGDSMSYRVTKSGRKVAKLQKRSEKVSLTQYPTGTCVFTYSSKF